MKLLPLPRGLRLVLHQRNLGVKLVTLTARRWGRWLLAMAPRAGLGCWRGGRGPQTGPPWPLSTQPLRFLTRNGWCCAGPRRAACCRAAAVLPRLHCPDRCPPRPADHPSAARMSPRALWRPVTAARGARTAPARPRPWRRAPPPAPPPSPAPHPAHPNSGGTERRAWADAAPDLGGPRAGLHPAACRPAGWWPAELRAPTKLAALRRTILLSS